MFVLIFKTLGLGIGASSGSLVNYIEIEFEVEMIHYIRQILLIQYYYYNCKVLCVLVMLILKLCMISFVVNILQEQHGRRKWFGALQTT